MAVSLIPVVGSLAVKEFYGALRVHMARRNALFHPTSSQHCWTPLRSLEQLLPLLQFFALQIFELLAFWQRRFDLSLKEQRVMRWKVLVAVTALATLMGSMLFQLGYFAPLSSRVRGLFVKRHTGNPLVDSVAEHQATSPRAYWQFFHHMCALAPLGFFLTLVRISEAKSCSAAFLL
eukprot:Skav233732  [mRNA]  locus=scaffold2225:171642:175266:+ [translate_table: standard]